MDTDTGITIDQCAEISRQLGAALELQDIYSEFICIAGVFSWIKETAQIITTISKEYWKTISECVFEKMKELQRFYAKLIGVEDELLTFITAKNETYVIPFNEIIESIEELPW